MRPVNMDRKISAVTTDPMTVQTTKSSKMRIGFMFRLARSGE
jgi:hypothetical protein